MIPSQLLFGFIAVSVCWGLTNPWIRKGAQYAEIRASSYKNKSWFYQQWCLFTEWRYIFPLAINLSGSAAYYYFLASAELSLVVPIVNALTLVMTVVGGKFLGEQLHLSLVIIIGCLMVVSGATICALSK